MRIFEFFYWVLIVYSSMKYLIDTCVVPELIKKSPDSGVIEWIDAQNEMDISLSVITFSEIQKDISKLDDKSGKSKIQLWLEDSEERFDNRIIELDISTMLDWGYILGNLSRKEINIPAIDSLLRASILNNHLCQFLVTGMILNIAGLNKFAFLH